MASPSGQLVALLAPALWSPHSRRFGDDVALGVQDIVAFRSVNVALLSRRGCERIQGDE